MERVQTVDRYTCHLFSSRGTDDVVIYLYDPGSNLVGKVYFLPDGDPLPPAEQREGELCCYTLYYPRASLPSVLDLLRNEGPISIVWRGGMDTSLSTEYEPVGEGEGIGVR